MRGGGLDGAATDFKHENQKTKFAANSVNFVVRGGEQRIHEPKLQQTSISVCEHKHVTTFHSNICGSFPRKKHFIH